MTVVLIVWTTLPESSFKLAGGTQYSSRGTSSLLEAFQGWKARVRLCSWSIGKTQLTWRGG